MRLRFYIDPSTGEAHIHNHDVEEWEVYEVFENGEDDLAGRNRTRSLFGQTHGGRWLHVVYTEGEERGDVLIVTAYPPHPKAVRALRRRLKKRK